ncbi:dual specificity protein phosphatase family protein [Peribacillus butanolivorans]|uniref:protein-tyrosine phosphatase family protein n=1 Tax=Peribacillus butanolivorans TaxID=421767 RepID=UPI003D29B566
MGFVEMIPGRLYIGGRISSDDWGFVQRNISVIVNLHTKPDRPPFDFSRRIMIWVPITIRVTPSLELVDNLIKQLNQLFDQGYRILIHDTLGIQRLGFIMTAFYMQKYRLNREEALYLVKQKKPDIKPTENYLQLLTQYEKYLNL